MFVQSIAITDFQAHHDLKLDLHKNITTIQGPTDKGKSAVLRALRWVCLNDMPGEDFIHEDAKKAIIFLDVKDGDGTFTISRIKGRNASVNLYAMDGKDYKSFVTSVPEDIAKKLRVNEINFQAQHDSPFWFAETAGEVSRRLNAVIDLSVIDTTLMNISGEVRKAIDRKDLNEERVKEITTELEKIAAQKDRVDDFAKLKKKKGAFDQVETTCERLVELIDRIRERTESINQRKEKLEAMEDLLDKARVYFKLDRRVETLQDIMSVGARLQKQSVAPPLFFPVEAAFEDLEEVSKKATSLGSLIERIGTADFRTRSSADVFIRAQTKFNDGTRGERCPLCNHPLE